MTLTLPPAPVLQGVLAPLLSPFHADGSIDSERFVEHAHWALDAGCHALVPFGTTSEAASLGIVERKQLLEALIDSGIDPKRLLPGTGMCALSDTLSLTRHAADLGCFGVLLLPPFYYKNISDEGIFRYVADLIARMGGTEFRLFLYHIPPIAAVGYTAQLVARLVAEFPDIVVGLKDSSGDMAYSTRLIEALPGFAVFSGSDDLLLVNQNAGGAGTITALANINAPAIRALFDAPEASGAAQHQQQIAAVRDIIRKAGTIPALKAVVSHYRGASSFVHVRPPLLPLNHAERAALIAALEQQGFTPAF
jgi:4-hydroxy-tetrahydrodipicolinate synthase